MPYSAALDVLQRGDRRLRRARQRGEARRRLVDRVAVRHPARLLGRRAGQQPPGSATVSCERPNSPTSAPSTRPPSVQHQRLHAVTDAQHRDPELEQLRIQPRRARRVHRRRPAGEDQPLRLAPPHLLDADVVRQQLREHAALAHPARDQLRVLAAVVEHDDLVGRRPRARARAPRRLVGREGRARAPRMRSSVCDKRHCRRRARPCRCAWSRWSCLPSVCSAGATISSARLNSAMS